MKNKIIVNILVVYFLILSFVLLIQVNSKETNAIEPLPSEITAEDKLKNSVVLSVDSPVILVNEKQFLIDEKDASITPIIQDGKVYIPVTLLETGFNANISFSSAKKETTVRLNNKAIIFPNNTNQIDVIDSISEEKLEIESNSKIINDRFYIPLRTFAQIFEKEIFIYNDLIIVSNIENIFDPIEEIDVIEEILNRVNNLPIVGNQENIKKLIYKYKLDNNLETEERKFLINTEIFTNTTIENSTEPTTQFKENEEESTINNIEDKETILENTRYYIKSIGNYNFYANKEFLEIFIKENEKEEFSFKIELINNQLVDIILKENNLILTYSSLGKEDLEKDYSLTIIYDISDKNNIKKINEISTNGIFYDNIINNEYIYILTKLDAIKANKHNILPLYERKVYEESTKNTYFKENVNLNDVYYFPDINDKNYTLVATINLKNLNENMKTNTFFGMGGNIVLNEEYLYIATNNKGKSNVYLFRLNSGNFQYIDRVSLNGEILDINNGIIFNENLLTLKTDKEEKIYTKELEEVN